MSRLITSTERIEKVQQLIEKARTMERPVEGPWKDFTYTAEIKDLMRQARDLLKFIPYTSGVPDEIKEEAKTLQKEIDQTEKELLH
jgi:hypothetical protein